MTKACALIVAGALGLGVAAGAAAQDTSGRGDGLQLGIGKSRVIETPGPYTDVLVGDPKIADVAPVSNHSLSVIAKGMGATTLTIYGPHKRLIYATNVYVTPDLEGLKSRLHDVLPDEKDLAVRGANDQIVVYGTVSSPASLKQALELADSYAPNKVINMVGVEGTQQVMLSVRFVEMERTAAKNLNISGSVAHNGNPIFGFQSGAGQVGGGGGPLAGTLLNKFLVPSGAYSAAQLVINGDIGLGFDAMESKGLIKTLAEPTLVAMSGDTASFLVGGEIPIPVNQSSTGGAGGSTISIEFKQFGISLAFTPTILKDGMINLVVNPEVSSVDPTVSFTQNGLSIPGFKVRRAKTTVELRDGESFTIAGLLSDNYESTIKSLPFVNDIPILGALFRSPEFKKDQTELVIVVTPHLAVPRRGPTATPADHFVPPSDYELFLFGAQRGARGALTPEDRALMSHDPNKGGVDGPYGHVVY